MEFQSLSIRKLLDAVYSGAIRIPAFQRGFVWEPERIAYLMDSIHKGYPFGSLLFWRTKTQLKIERNLGPFELPVPKEDYPIDYVLDGQQRLTSIFSVFQTELKPAKTDDEWPKIYFDITAEGNAQESQFVPLFDTEVDKGRHFPLAVLFDSVAYRDATSVFDKEIIGRIDKLQETFKEVTIPVQLLKTEERSIVAIVFERVNRLGMELDTLQLLAAWTWNEDFDLLDKFRELKDELEEFGFSEVGEDSDLVLRCAGAVLKGEPLAESLLDLNGQQVREEFPRVKNGILGAIDFLRNQLRVVSLKNLPYSSLLIPLCVFFAEPDGKEVVYGGDTYRKLKRWFWKSCFSARYTSQTSRTTVYDIGEMLKLKNGETSSLGDINVAVEASYFVDTYFRLGNAGTKTFVLMLANNSPKTFLSGADVDLDRVLQKYNRAEFHHVYPRAYLRDLDEIDARINCLANFSFLNSAENKKIGRKKPSEYAALMPSGESLKVVLDGAIMPDVVFNDDFDLFLKERSVKLADYANSLLAE